VYKSPVSCPWCGAETYLIVPSGFGVWDYHAGDWPHEVSGCNKKHKEYWKCEKWKSAGLEPGTDTNSADEHTIYCQKCGMPIHYVVAEGVDKIPKELAHPIERFLDFPGKFRRKRAFFSLLGVSDMRIIYPFLLSMALGIFVSILGYFFLTLFTEATYLFLSSFVWGCFLGIVTFFLYLTLKEFKLALGRLLLFTPRIHGKVDASLFMFRFSAWGISMIVAFMVFAIDNGIMPTRWYEDFTGLPTLLIFGFALQVFAGFGGFLLACSTRSPYINPHFRGEYLQIRSAIQPLIEIGISGVLLVAVWLWVTGTLTYFFPLPSNIGRSIEDFMLGLVLPIVAVLLVFWGYIYLLHRILSTLKYSSLAEVRDDLAALRNMVKEISEGDYRSLNIKLSYLIALEDKLSSAEDWPVSVGIVLEVASGIFLAILPWLLQRFIT